MGNRSRSQNIKAIIKLEDRIGQCRRCHRLLKCTDKPSLGKGDLEPEAIIVFECESSQSLDNSWIMELRNYIQSHWMIDSIYHTFLTRCHAKYCINEYANTSISAGKLVDEQGLCILTNQPCNGIAIRPSNEEIINCLGFFLEEIKILQPKYIILYGERVKEFVLRTFGLLELPPGQQVVKHNGFIFIAIEEDELPNIAEIDVQYPSY